mgnify:CR=1 FL=1
MDIKQTDSEKPLTAKDEEIIHAASTRGPHILKGVKSAERVIDLSSYLGRDVILAAAAILAVKNHTGAAWADIFVGAPVRTATASITAIPADDVEAVLQWTVKLPRPLTDAEFGAVLDWHDTKVCAERDSMRAASTPAALHNLPRDPNQAMIDRDGPAKAKTPAVLLSQPGPAPAKPTPPLPVADITRTGTHFGRWGAGS